MWIIWLGRTENDPHFCKADADLLATMPSYYKLSKFGVSCYFLDPAHMQGICCQRAFQSRIAALNARSLIVKCFPAFGIPMWMAIPPEVFPDVHFHDHAIIRGRASGHAKRTVDFAGCVRTAKLQDVAVRSPVRHGIAHGTAWRPVGPHAGRRFLLAPEVERNDGLSLDVSRGLVNLQLIIACVQHEKPRSGSGCGLFHQARRLFSVIDMRRRDFQHKRQFAFRIDRQMEFVPKPGDLVAERIEFHSPIGIAGLFAFSLGLLSLVSTDGGAVNCHVAAVQNTF